MPSAEDIIAALGPDFEEILELQGLLASAEGLEECQVLNAAMARHFEENPGAHHLMETAEGQEELKSRILNGRYCAQPPQSGNKKKKEEEEQEEKENENSN
jgi:hypothetical protein